MTNLLKIIWDLFKRLLTVTPLTFAFLIMLLAGYYFLRIYLWDDYIKANPQTKLPKVIIEYFSNTPTSGYIFHFFIKVIEFVIFTFVFLRLEKAMGFPIPHGTF